MYASRDQATGEYYEKLLRAGAVKLEFSLLGCVYLERGQLGYYVTEKEEKFFQFLLQCERNNIYTTPATLQADWCMVAKGERQTLKRNLQIRLLKKLRAQYHHDFFDAIRKLNGLIAQDWATPLLEPWYHALDSCFDADLLHLFESTLSMMAQMKLLQDGSKQKYLRWLQKQQKQLEVDEVAQEGERHIYAGFGYLEREDRRQITYKQYTKYYTAWRERQRFLQQGKVVSPVFTKTYFFDAIGFQVIQNAKQQFLQTMERIMDQQYFAMLEKCYTLPSILPIEQYEQLYRQIYLQGHQEEANTFALYGAQLRLFSSFWP